MNRKNQWKYLFEIIRYSLSGGECPKAEEAPDWEYLYRISKHHKIESVVCNGIEQMPPEVHPKEEILEKFREALKIGMAREAVQHFALEELLDAFETEEVACLPLKGILLKQFYPRPDLRMMADLDILYRPEQEEKVDEILLKLGYDCDHKDDHHNVYFRNPFMNIEMHHSLISGNRRLVSYYENVWERAEVQEGKRFVYRFRWEDYYIFMLVHMAKHFQNGGSGIRSVMDIWRFTEAQKDSLDWDYVKAELGKIHLGAFEESMRKLSDVWFKGAESTELSDSLTDMMVNCGVYGNMSNYYLNQVVQASGEKESVRRGQIRMQMLVVFLPLEYMRQQYHYLEKYPALLPVAWMQRILRTCFRRPGRASEVLRRTMVERSEAEKRKELFEKLDLWK